MPYLLHINRSQQILELHYQGVIDISDREEARRHFFQVCREENLHRGLVELQQCETKMSHDNLIRFASSFKNMDLPERFRLAGVIKPDDKVNRLLEIILSQEGIDTRFFMNRDDAIRWLSAY